ncbi:hypothetical protein AMATHDRAFT_8425 [Amanita thiersii Skay4041]|uniref:SnoaL-like domain-containing protein n=1 Tax=Amanita thiersii Skay4041 TaxID=703135 RepID=A0A2A9NE91_9AGAR|nr:hypothetical protein AMATHDRAFT_8425 [Amanita thiersii Skay4041]
MSMSNMFSTRPSTSSAASELASWLQGHMSEMVKTSDPEEFKRLFNDIFADNAKFHINGEDMKREDLLNRMMERKKNQQSANMEVRGMVAVPRDENRPEMGGYAGSFVITTIQRKDSNKIYRAIVCANLDIENSNSSRGARDGRKITRVHEVAIETEEEK